MIFRAVEITAGHAVILARLRPEDQERVLGTKKGTRAEQEGGLFEGERLLWDPYSGGGRAAEHRKAVSVKELQAWVDKNVRFRDADADPMLFPATAEALGATKQAEKPAKVIPITHEHFVVEHAREGRTWGPQSWKRADGKKGSKTCEHAVLGVVAIGPGRGEAFEVCVAKDKCKTHWGAWQRERAKGRKAAVTSGKTGRDRYAELEAKQKAERERADAERKRWEKATPALLDALAEGVAKMPVNAGGPFDRLLSQAAASGGYRTPKHKGLPRGTTAEDLVRHVGFRLLLGCANPFAIARDLPAPAKAFGVDARKIVEQVAPAEKPKAAEKAQPKKAAKKKARRK